MDRKKTAPLQEAAFCICTEEGAFFRAVLRESQTRSALVNRKPWRKTGNPRQRKYVGIFMKSSRVKLSILSIIQGKAKSRAMNMDRIFGTKVSVIS